MYQPKEPSNVHNIHKDRVSNLGRKLKIRIDNHGYFVTYCVLLDWAGKELRCAPVTVEESLKHMDLWEGPDPCGWTMESVQNRIINHD